jgi:molybdate transport system permease protein
MSTRDSLRSAPPDWPFFLGLSLLGGVYVLLVAALLLADAGFLLRDLPPDAPWQGLWKLGQHVQRLLGSPEIRHAIVLSLVSCSITTILSLWTAVPLGYLLSRFSFRGKGVVDALLDIPIVLPPLVIGLSLLLLFQTPPGRWLEDVSQRRLGVAVTHVALPLLAVLVAWLLGRAFVASEPRTQRSGVSGWLLALTAGAAVFVLLRSTRLGGWIEEWTQAHLATRITYGVPSVILAQYAVACAFAVRTMRVTFDQINPRCEQVALTLGCSRSQAFWWVLLPAARRGMITAATLAWARALGEFGPILVFSGATRMHTEVLPTTVFLELSVGNLEAAVAVSLLMVVTAVLVLVIVRLFGLDPTARRRTQP